MNIEIANRLVQLRKQKNLSQEELAAKLGISRQAVSKWERAESSPDTDNLILLARLYGVSLDDLLRTDGPVGAKEGGASKEPPPAGPPPQTDAKGDDDPDSAPWSHKHPTPPGWRAAHPALNVLQGIFPICVTILFFVLTFLGPPFPWWIVFLAIPIFYGIVTASRRAWRDQHPPEG